MEEKIRKNTHFDVHILLPFLSTSVVGGGEFKKI